MIENQQTPALSEILTQNRELTAAELHMIVREAEKLRSDFLYQALRTAFRFARQAPSRLFSSGTHRHA